MAALPAGSAAEGGSEQGEGILAPEGAGAASSCPAARMSIAMLALAGLPGTAGFFGKFYLIDATVQGQYTWLGVMIVVGSMISLVYYLRVIAVMWLGPVELRLPARPRTMRPVSGWSPEADAGAQPEVTAVAVITAAATVALGVIPSPLFDAAGDVGTSLAHLL